MSSILPQLLQQLTDGRKVEALSRQIGADQHATQNAIGAALPTLMAALARNASQPDGARSLEKALDRHDGSVLDNLPKFLDAPDTRDGDGILGHVLGQRRGTVERGISEASGIDRSAVGKLLPMLAPIVMGALGRQKRQQNLDADALSRTLGAERNQAEAANPAVGMLGRLLDQDGDGQVTDDLAKMGKSLLGGLLRRP